jgi:Uma2 family endonuclease
MESRGSSRTLTHRDLEFTPDDGNRYEIIDGELFVSPFPSVAHQEVVAALNEFLRAHVRQRKMGKVMPAGLKVVLDEPTGVGPDLVYISTARLGGLRSDGFYGPPDLVVEVVSSKPELDRFVKLNKYARAGVRHYWIVDPDQRRLDAYRLDGDCYRLALTRSHEESFEPELFPGLTIQLGDLWL